MSWHKTRYIADVGFCVEGNSSLSLQFLFLAILFFLAIFAVLVFQVSQHMVLTAVHLCNRCPGVPAALVGFKDAAIVAAEALRRGAVESSGCSPQEIEDLMKPRLELVQHMAYDKTIFAKTAIMEYLIALWNDSDQKYFGEICNRTFEELQRRFEKEPRYTSVENTGTTMKQINADTSHFTPHSALTTPLSAKSRQSGVDSGRSSLETASGMESRRSG